MSKSRDQTEPTPPLSSEGKTADQAQQSEPSPKTEPIKISTETSSSPSPSTSEAGSGGRSEREYLHAEMAKVSLTILFKAGLIKRYEVRAKDAEGNPTTLLKIRYEFDLQQWTDNLELK